MTSKPDESELKLSFDPGTIEHLGFKMYSRLPNAIAELVANSYDADATHVRVVVDATVAQSVRVIDDGHGMSYSDLAEKYLRIGRNRRNEDSGVSESGRRKVAGRKGLGKLALFGIGDTITIRTKRAGSSERAEVVMNWKSLKDSVGGDYYPKVQIHQGVDIESHGTEIVVRHLKRRTRIDVQALATSLSHLFNYTDENFSVVVSDSVKSDFTEISRGLRYASIDEESRWGIPDGFQAPAPNKDVKGEIIAARKPLRQDLRGLTIYVKGRLANDPEFFGVPESSYAYSYITGYVEADYLDDLEDVVATDRRSINWESAQASDLKFYLESVLREVASLRRESRKKAKADELRTDLDVDVEEWTGTIENEAAADSVRQVLDVLVSPDTELADDDRAQLVEGLRGVAPEHADLHWRSLHPDVKSAAESLYRDGHYFQALLEAIKRYVKDIESMPNVSGVDYNALGSAFGGEEPRLDIARPFIPAIIKDETAKNIRVAQRTLSEGLWQGFRSPLAHEIVEDLANHEVFSYQDCLDALSLLSHLRRRVSAAIEALEP